MRRTSLFPFRSSSRRAFGWVAPNNLLVARKVHSKSKTLGTPGEARILGIESSCDDTGVCVAHQSKGFIAEQLASQHHVNHLRGGIVPPLAARQHRKMIPLLLERALCQVYAHDRGEAANVAPIEVEQFLPDPDMFNEQHFEDKDLPLSRQAEVAVSTMNAIAVTVGPGLGPCLRLGVSAAQVLSRKYKVPLIPVNHLEAHALVTRSKQHLPFPFLVLLLSGGHSQLLVARDVGQFQLLGGTVDDSLGEAFDKVARMLNYDTSKEHGGAVLEKKALQGDPWKYALPVPMRKYKNCDFSFSGLKSAVRNLIEKESIGEDKAPHVAASFQRVALEHVMERTRRAIWWTKENLSADVQNIVVSGGVAKNALLRSQMATLVSEFEGMNCIFPPMSLCTDNGAMIAWAGMEHYNKGHLVTPEESESLKASPRFPLDRSFTPGELFPSSMLPRLGSRTHKSAVSS